MAHYPSNFRKFDKQQEFNQNGEEISPLIESGLMKAVPFFRLVNRLFSSFYHLPLDTFLFELGSLLNLSRAAVYFNRLDHRWQLVAHRLSEWHAEKETKGFPDHIEYQQLRPGLETRLSQGEMVPLKEAEIESLGFLSERKHHFYFFPLFDSRWWTGIIVLDFGERTISPEEESLLKELSQALSLAITRQRKESEYFDVTRVFQELLNHIPDIVLLVDTQGKWLLANKNFLQFLQFKRNVYQGLTFKEIAEIRSNYASLLEKLDEIIKKLVAREAPLKEVIAFRSGDRKFWWELCFIPFKCDQEKRILILGRDISSLKLAQERLLTILENLPVMVYVVSPENGKILYHNLSFQEYFGEKLIGKEPCYEVLFGQKDICSFCSLKKAELGKKEVKEFFDSKRERWLRNYEVYISWLDDKLVRLGMLEDITEFKKQEEELIRSQKMELMGKMSGNIAHEFNNILTVVEGYVDLLSLNLSEDQKLSTYLERIRSAVKSGSDLIRQLLILSSGKSQSDKNQITDINHFILDQLDLFKRILGEAIELKAKLAPQPLPVNLSYEDLQHILTNLVINARDAMPRGGILSLETEVVETGKGRQAVLRISDTGTGIDPQDLAHIFEPFYTTKAPGEGSGLGLNIVLSIVKRAGGEIKVASEPKKGTTFEILLPLIENSEKNKIFGEDQKGSLVTREKMSDKKRILVVEDEPYIREMLAEMLEGKDFEVVTAENGQVALDWLRAHNYEVDLIITDVVMPKIDGVQLYRLLQKEAPHLIIIFISGYADHMLAKYGFDESAFRILKKPFTFQQLLDEIHKVLD